MCLWRIFRNGDEAREDPFAGRGCAAPKKSTGKAKTGNCSVCFMFPRKNISNNNEIQLG